jgi:sortase A
LVVIRRVGVAADKIPTMDAPTGIEPRRRGWRLVRVIGWLLIGGGLLLLGWVGWQFYGTNWVSHRTQHRIVEQVQRQWTNGPRRPVHTSHGTVGALLRIPRFGSSWVVPIVKGTSDDALASGVGHYSGTANPGRRGNFALAGHRVTHGEPFHDLPELRPGDRVVVDTAHKIYTYVLDTGGDDLTLPFTATWVLDPSPVNPSRGTRPDPQTNRLITLTTCSELFHTDNRLVVFGHLQSVRPQTRPSAPAA